MYQISNSFLSIKVNPIGAELSSLKNLENGKELLWQGDPEIWASQAPNLFPIIGALKEGIFRYEERSYSMPKHGIARFNRNFSLVNKTDHVLCFQLNHSEETWKHYPFRFSLEITFLLSDRSLWVDHKILNLDDKRMYFSLGGHPAFNIPLFPEESYEDYFLEFDRKMDLSTWLLNNDGLVSENTRGILDNQNILHLEKDLFKDDALIFKNIPSKKVRLISRKTGEILTLIYADFKNLAIWAKPGAPFVCLEPWLGIADHKDTDQELVTKEDMEKLEKGEAFNAAYQISLPSTS